MTDIFLTTALVLSGVVIFLLVRRNIRLTEKLLQKNYKSNAITIPIWQRDANLSITYCNSTYADICEIAGDTKIPELYNGAISIAKQAISKNAAYSLDKHIIVAGNRRLFRVTEIPAQDGKTVGFAYDIGDLDDIKQKLKQHLSVQADLLDSSRSAIAIYGADKKLRFFNNAFINLWKLDERWLATEPTYSEILEVLREKRKLPEQANFKSFKKDNLAMFTNLVEKHEEFWYLPDGKVLRKIVIPHEHGGLLVSSEDMTDQIALERSYNTLLSVKASTLDNLFEAIAVFGEDGRLQLNNPVYTNMWHLESVMLKSEPHISDILDETKFLYEYEGRWEDFKQEIISIVSRRLPYEQRLERKDGSVVDWTCVPLPDGAILMTYIDITDSTRVEESLRAEKTALEEADQLKTGFLANVSYELRSPLTTIKGFSEVLLQDYFGTLNKKQEEYIEGIFDSSEKLTSLIDNILNISAIDAGYMTLEISDFNIKETLIAALNEVKNSEGVDLILDCQSDIGTLTGDQKRIKQIIVHLLSNSINFTEMGGKVILSATKENDDILIAVEDTGAGIPPEEIPVIFKKFYKTGSSGFSGIGLGLPIAMRFIELHGGTIDLESEEGKGTKVTCTLKQKNRELLKKYKYAR